MLYVMKCLLLVVVHCFSSISASRSRPTDVTQVCETETFEATCKKNEVIVMTHGWYGRMRIGRCVRRGLGYIGCGADVLRESHWRCSGRRSCLIRIPDSTFDAAHSCMDELKTYYEAAFSCVQVFMPPGNQCASAKYVSISAKEGYIASTVTDNTGCGSATIPWQIDSLPGQRVNLTFYDFSPVMTNDDRGKPIPYVTFQEPKDKSKKIYADPTRRTRYYTTMNHTLQIKINRHEKENQNRVFLIHYQVIGCATPQLPKDAWSRENGDIMTVGCAHSQQQWKLTCRNSKWVGYIGNCTEQDENGIERSHRDDEMSTIPYGASIAIVLALSLAVAVLIVIMGLVCIRRLRLHNHRPRVPVGEELVYNDSTYPLHPRTNIDNRPKGGVKLHGLISCDRHMDGDIVYHEMPVRIDGSRYTNVWECPHSTMHPSLADENPDILSRTVTKPGINVLQNQREQLDLDFLMNARPVPECQCNFSSFKAPPSNVPSKPDDKPNSPPPP